MEKESQKLGRAYLVKKLRERGLSYRHSVRIVNFIFAEMAKTLKRGGVVPFPFGKLKRVKRHFSKWWDHVGDPPANSSLYTVEHVLDEAGGQELNGWRWPKKGRGVRKEVVSK
jgi:hypothetical protein